MARNILTLSAALVFYAFSGTPAAAQDWRGDGHASQEVRSRAGPGDSHSCRNGPDTRHDRRGGGFGCSSFDDSFAYADGTWALYNNRSWEPDSYNDWWHDRPDRAFPRWVLEQHARGTCDANRMWWSGSGWHC